MSYDSFMIGVRLLQPGSLRSLKAESCPAPYRALEQLSTAFASLRKASKEARDGAYLRSLAAAAGVTVKEYKRFLDMFHKIDTNKTGAISKKELMDAMKKDKDVSASGCPVLRLSSFVGKHSTSFSRKSLRISKPSLPFRVRRFRVCAPTQSSRKCRTDKRSGSIARLSDRFAGRERPRNHEPIMVQGLQSSRVLSLLSN
jgi:hypothetical protein